MEEENFKMQYGEIYLVLAGYFAVDADDGIFDVPSTLERYINDGPAEESFKALSQAQEVLKLEPFPERLIGNLTNTYIPSQTMKEYLQEIADALEAKLRERGFTQTPEASGRGR